MAAKKRSATLAHVHETPLAVASVEMTPPHDERVETPEYERARHFLIYTKNSPCEICGVTRRTLKNPAKNPYGAVQMEAHHYPIERSLASACDPRRVHKDFPQVYDMTTLLAFVDSPANLKILCDQCHRSPEHGIHHLLSQDWIIQKYLRTRYVIAAAQKAVSAAQATDEQIMQAAGMEPAQQQQAS